MSKLSTGRRKELPESEFAGPGRSYPINDMIHARKAVQMAPHAGSGATAIRRKVHERYPSIHISGGK